MEESGLFFFSSYAPSSVVFRLATKQEFENVGVVIPGSSMAPSQIATLNLLTGETRIAAMSELVAKVEIRAVGFRPLVKTQDPRLNRTCEDNLRLQAQKLLLPDENKPAEVSDMLLGGKTPITERLKFFISEIGLAPIPGKICIRVLEELGELEASPTPLGVYAALFKTWFAGGEIADLLTTLVVGKSEHFLPLVYRGVRREGQSGERGPPPARESSSELLLVQELLAKAVADPDATLRLTYRPERSEAERSLAHPARPDGKSAEGELRRQEPRNGGASALSPSKIAEWASNAVKMMTLPELPVIDLAPLLNWVDLQPPQHSSRCCIVTTKPSLKLQPVGDVVVDRFGFGLNFLTHQELQELDWKLSQSGTPEDQALRTLIAQRLAT